MKKNEISYGALNDSNLKVFICLSRATQALHKRAGKIFGEGGLTTSQFAVLEVLYHKGELTINEIIEKILSSSGNVTVVINNLEKDALIVRRINPADKRSWMISITEKGKQQIEEIFPSHLKDLGISFQNLTEEEKLTLISIARKIEV
ncbi:MarR family winged helix-turn-helix transcriptional regulator [Parasporobacterium paucivorans]|uniref:DNA-binding transcriptional regulator, MarR family n=1 Tax=Parasporobacterium paucivorans DSM 15970 TaxID=1122934 RepID=A0A1M6D034_9FIRM|nr:MarR family transcriptional regulator [Parasporobacterium paucivorans]SHI66606.1 DNA-binding transcriptional regulator, MarR family [Parasporobacterium paucivorans DSM 15970]